ncbi:MAG: sterol carrier family protein [Bifidobacteriaceae bacterium]|nr:sterol carrier family protein [Bifidobacteriaceae bacterium]
MGARRKITPADGQAALARWRAQGEALARPQLATAVRFALEELAAQAPGPAVEVRVPPFGAAQCAPGPRHTRGTPPNVVEAAPQAFLALATGSLNWHDAVRSGQVLASGARADLSPYLPLGGLGAGDQAGGDPG